MKVVPDETDTRIDAMNVMTQWADAFEMHRQEILRFLERRLWGRLELAEDLCQETFARVLRAGVEMRDPAKARSYLFRTANNLLINHIRRGRRVVIESDLGEGADLERAEDTSAYDPHRAAEAAQLREKIQELVLELPGDQRIAFERGVIRREPYEEIARDNNWSVAKVKTCVFRARKQLMTNLEEYR